MTPPENEDAPAIGQGVGVQRFGNGLPLNDITAGALRVFEFETVSPIRVVIVDGDPWFVGRDVAELLGYARPNDALQQHCKGAVKRRPLLTPGGIQRLRIISEADLWRLVAKSQLPEAQRVESWIFEEVLPSIRRTGRYGDPGIPGDLPGALRLAATLAEQVEDQAARLEKQRMALGEAEAAVSFAAQVAASWESHSLKDAAAILRQQGVLETGRTRLADFLRTLHWTDCNNSPNQRAVEAGYLERKITSWMHPGTGMAQVRATTRVTGKGLKKLHELLAKAPRGDE